MKKNGLVLTSICAVFALLLQGCVPVAIGVGLAGTGVIYTHSKPFKRFYNDNDITNQAFARIKADRYLAGSRVLVAVKNRNVLLIGQTPSPSQRMEAERIITSIPGVGRVYNAITISGATSSLTQSSDSWITTKIKNELLETKYIRSTRIKVVTENGVVYLMGNVSKYQGDIATEVARRVTGVQKVVKLFDYMD